MRYFDVKMSYALVVVAFLLFAYSVLGAITFSSSLNQQSGLNRDLRELIYLVVTALILTLIGRAIGIGIVIMGAKNPLEAKLLAFVGVLVFGSVLALFTLLNVPFLAQLNLFWLGRNWYDPWITILILSAPIMLAFVI